MQLKDQIRWGLKVSFSRFSNLEVTDDLSKALYVEWWSKAGIHTIPNDTAVLVVRILRWLGTDWWMATAPAHWLCPWLPHGPPHGPVAKSTFQPAEDLWNPARLYGELVGFQAISVSKYPDGHRWLEAVFEVDWEVSGKWKKNWDNNHEQFFRELCFWRGGERQAETGGRWWLWGCAIVFFVLFRWERFEHI